MSLGGLAQMAKSLLHECAHAAGVDARTCVDAVLEASTTSNNGTSLPLVPPVLGGRSPALEERSLGAAGGLAVEAVRPASSDAAGAPPSG